MPATLGLADTRVPQQRKETRVDSEDNETVDLRTKEPGWHYVGRIGIDTATCWIGDPTYEVPYFADEPGLVPYLGIEREDDIGRGVLVSTGFGDGAYPVYVRADDDSGRTVGVLIDFGMTDVQRRLFYGTS
jgi:hypothetical protein